MKRIIKCGVIAALTLAASLTVPTPAFADGACEIDPARLCGVICLEICVLGECSNFYQEISGRRVGE